MSETNHAIKCQPSRRAFVASAATVVLFGGSLATMLEGCGGSPTSPSNAPALPVVSGTRTVSGVTVAVDASSPLFATGGAALVQSSVGDFLVSHPTQNGFAALTAVCTHQGCTITGFANQDFVCPCHGSTYDVNGRVLSGPAVAPLQTFAAALANGILTIAV